MISAFADKRSFQLTILRDHPGRSNNFTAVLTKADIGITIFNDAYSGTNPEAYQMTVIDTSLFAWVNKVQAEQLSTDFIAAAVKIPNVYLISSDEGGLDRFPPVN